MRLPLLLALALGLLLPACNGEECSVPDAQTKCERHCTEAVACKRHDVGDVDEEAEMKLCLDDCLENPCSYELDDRGCEDLTACDYINCLK